MLIHNSGLSLLQYSNNVLVLCVLLQVCSAISTAIQAAWNILQVGWHMYTVYSIVYHMSIRGVRRRGGGV